VLIGQPVATMRVTIIRRSSTRTFLQYQSLIYLI
jgi:hypothetical protein